MSYKIEDYKSITAEVVMVTPKMAAEMLTRNYNNRPISKRDVNKYIEAIRSGSWEVTNQGIGFSKDGTLKDGQHRLTAIVKSNIPAPLLIVRGLENDTSMIDRNRTRTVGNIIAMNGMRLECAPQKVCATANCLLRLSGIDHPTELQTMKFVEKDADQLVQSVKLARVGANHPICDKAAVFAGIYCALYNGISEARIARFCEVANTGFANGDFESSAIVFRNHLMQTNMNHSVKASVDSVFMQCTRAIKDFAGSKPRRNQYTGDPVFLTSVKEHIKTEVVP